jgi:hypothetical protein
MKRPVTAISSRDFRGDRRAANTAQGPIRPLHLLVFFISGVDFYEQS